MHILRQHAFTAHHRSNCLIIYSIGITDSSGEGEWNITKQISFRISSQIKAKMKRDYKNSLGNFCVNLHVFSFCDLLNMAVSSSDDVVSNAMKINER
jgi:hypothetical protein